MEKVALTYPEENKQKRKTRNQQEKQVQLKHERQIQVQPVPRPSSTRHTQGRTELMHEQQKETEEARHPLSPRCAQNPTDMTNEQSGVEGPLHPSSQCHTKNPIELTHEQALKVEAALRPANPEEILVAGFGQDITQTDLTILYHLNWLNDKIINFYMGLLMEREKGNDTPRIHVFSSFFFSKLQKDGQR